MITVQGAYGIYATVLKHSISPAGVNLITLEISYPRIVLAELNTHGMLPKNSSSSRAIPFAKMQEQLTGRPVRFGEANPGMQDKGADYNRQVLFEIPVEFDTPCDSGLFRFERTTLTPQDAWEEGKAQAVALSKAYFDAGYHKQVYNRPTEPWQMMKTVISWTEGANFFWLRDDDAADPSLRELARVMREAASLSKPQLLNPGEWHLPYVDFIRGNDGRIIYGDLVEHPEDSTLEALNPFSLEQAIKVSTARTAAVSFRNVDYGVEKSEEVFAKLTSDARIHGSAMAHQATPMKAEHIAWTPHDPIMKYSVERSVNIPHHPETWEKGISHMDRDGQLWSAQFRGWRMHRKLIDGENVPGFI